MIRVEVLGQGGIEAALGDLAQLRITVFHEFPYLYDGDLEYEQRYLQVYRDSPGAVVVAAWDGQTMVGASTGLPLEDHADDFGAPLKAMGVPEQDVFYCAESVLLPDYRGSGLGHAFFDHREEKARTLGRSRSMFCSVIRPEDHPARPADYRSLEGFWEKRGYSPITGGKVSFSWRDIGEAEETSKTLQMWMRNL